MTWVSDIKVDPQKGFLLLLYIWERIFRKNISIWEGIFSSEKEYFHLRKNIFIWERIFPSEKEYFHLRKNISIWERIFPSEKEYFKLTRAAIQGQPWGLAFIPPTMREPLPETVVVFIFPHAGGNFHEKCVFRHIEMLVNSTSCIRSSLW